MIATLILLPVVLQSVSAQNHDTYFYGWGDGFRNWVFYAKRADDDEGHLQAYWDGVDAGMKYAQHHVTVRVINGHVLSDYKAVEYIDGWLDGQLSHLRGESSANLTQPLYGYLKGFYDGYNAPPQTLPPHV